MHRLSLMCAWLPPSPSCSFMTRSDAWQSAIISHHRQPPLGLPPLRLPPPLCPRSPSPRLPPSQQPPPPPSSSHTSSPHGPPPPCLCCSLSRTRLVHLPPLLSRTPTLRRPFPTHCLNRPSSRSPSPPPSLSSTSTSGLKQLSSISLIALLLSCPPFPTRNPPNHHMPCQHLIQHHPWKQLHQGRLEEGELPSYLALFQEAAQIRVGAGAAAAAAAPSAADQCRRTHQPCPQQP